MTQDISYILSIDDGCYESCPCQHMCKICTYSGEEKECILTGDIIMQIFRNNNFKIIGDIQDNDLEHFFEYVPFCDIEKIKLEIENKKKSYQNGMVIGNVKRDLYARDKWQITLTSFINRVTVPTRFSKQMVELNKPLNILFDDNIITEIRATNTGWDCVNIMINDLLITTIYESCFSDNKFSLEIPFTKENKVLFCCKDTGAKFCVSIIGCVNISNGKRKQHIYKHYIRKNISNKKDEQDGYIVGMYIKCNKNFDERENIKIFENNTLLFDCSYDMLDKHSSNNTYKISFSNDHQLGCGIMTGLHVDFGNIDDVEVIYEMLRVIYYL